MRVIIKYQIWNSNKLLSKKLKGHKYVTLPLGIISFNLLLDKIEYMVIQLDDKPERIKMDERYILSCQTGGKLLKHNRDDELLLLYYINFRSKTQRLYFLHNSYVFRIKWR